MVLRGLRSSAFRFQRGIPHLFINWKSMGAMILYTSNCSSWVDVPFDSQLFQAQIVGTYPFISAEAVFRGLPRIVVSRRGLAFQPIWTSNLSLQPTHVPSGLLDGLLTSKFELQRKHNPMIFYICNCPSLNSKNGNQWFVILIKVVLHQYTVR